MPNARRCLGFLIGLLAPCLSASLAAERPNVLLIMTDDQGWGDLGCHGNEWVETPVIDALAARSVRFDRFFVSPVCAPTRAALLTGRHELRTGVSGVTKRLEVMRADEVTMAEAFRSAGYRTGAFGKWHNGEQYPNDPAGQGFETFLGFLGGQTNDYFDPVLVDVDGQSVPTEGYITDILTDAAIDFLGADADRPFFCYVPFNAIHTPWQVPDRYFEKYAARGLDPATACAYGMVENIDENVGRLLVALEESGRGGQTIVIFLTDNGPNGPRFNGGMRGIKASVHEGGVRVPCFVSWPGQLEPRLVAPIAAHLDLLPTLLELCSIPMPATEPLDGRSLVPLLRGESEGWPDRILFTTMGHPRNGRGSVRTDRYRFVREKGEEMLFDMVADPGQARDLAADRPEVRDRLSTALDAFLAEVRPSVAEVPPIPVGHAEAPRVRLSAPESIPADGLRFANTSGYAEDWLIDWDDPSETIAWDLEVVRAGRFAVDLIYACPEDSIGSRVRLSAGSDRLEFTIDRPFDEGTHPRPERQPAAEPRLARTFTTCEVGVIGLPEGQVRLTLQPLAIPGPIVCELNGIRLRRVR